MSTLAPCLQAFFTDRLITQRRASPHTIASYRDTFRLLLGFVQERTGKAPFQLDLADLDAPLVGAFLDYLERDRHNSVATRNIRLAALRSFLSFAAMSEPAHAAQIQRVLAIPQKRTDKPVVSFLAKDEITAICSSVDRTSWVGRRDYALLVLATQSGLRLSELTGLCCGDVVLQTGANVRCYGKGRKERSTPLTRQTVSVLTTWMRERNGERTDPLFPTRSGTRLSADAVQRRVDKYAAAAGERCPTLRSKHVTPHTLRHSAAMALLHAGVDIAVIALWLGHESIETTQIYLHADLSIKERALARTTPPEVTPGRYQATDSLLAFLDGL
jgi:site-specific recombinase XerD